MATRKETMDFILDQLTMLENVSARKMFGEYALYCDGKVVALVCDDILYVKITEAGREMLGDNYQEGYAYPGAKVSMLVEGDLIEDRQWFSRLISVTADSLPVPKIKKRK